MPPGSASSRPSVFAHEPSAPPRRLAAPRTLSTVSRLVQELLDAHFVTELSSNGPSGPGRPATPLALSSKRFVGVGLEFNVDYVAGKAIALDGTVVSQFREEHEARGSDPSEALAQIAPYI